MFVVRREGKHRSAKPRAPLVVAQSRFQWHLRRRASWTCCRVVLCKVVSRWKKATTDRGGD